jgi:hypothetical protein
MRFKNLLAPDPPRRIPGHRVMSVSLRTVHLATFGILVGGHVFDVEASRLIAFLAATVASGAGLVALELASTFDWLRTVKGLAVIAKLALLALIPVFWEHRVVMLVAAVVFASVVSHMPGRFRHARLF